MQDFQFYPTPRALAERAWALFKNRDFTRVLEPSAGDGDFADAHPWLSDTYHRSRQPIIDCCEIDITRHPTLRAKGYRVVGLDFLQFANAALYSHVILNPPFAQGAAHVLKAFDTLWDGEIVAIINADTLRNSYTRDRQRLAALIEEFGSFEIIEGAFSVPEAERRTDVDIALIYLKKTANVASDIVGDLIGDLRKDREDADSLAGGYAPEQAVALPNSFIENSVITFNAALAAMRDSVRYEARARHYAALIGNTMAVHSGAQGSSKPDYTTNWVKSALGERYEDLKDRAWANLLRSADVSSRLSSAAQNRLEREFDQIKQLEYTVLNIRSFLCGLMDSQGRIQEEMMCDCFDLITKWHTDNAVLGIGWKSNDKHRTAAMKIKTTRFILPGHTTASWQSGLSWDSLKLLSDFDKCFALLDGGKLAPEISLVSVFEKQFDALRAGDRVYASYFSVRYWPGRGTIHFFPSRPDLIDRLNRIVGRKRAWLPPTDTMATDAFWTAYDNAERYDKEIRAEIRKGRHAWWNDPLRQLSSDERKADAEASIVAAIEKVYTAHGISVDRLLADPTPARPQLELLEECA